MLKGKKSILDLSETAFRLLVAIAVISLLVLPVWNRVEAAFFNTDKKYIESFEKFVSGINDMGQGRETFLLRMKDQSAVIGFSKSAGRYECADCYAQVLNKLAVYFDKPAKPECAGRACICLCRDLKLEDGTENGKSIKTGKCSGIQCGELNADVPERASEYWKNGFLYARGVQGANGLNPNTEENVNLVAERRGNMVGICSYDLLGFNRDTLGIDRCIITALDQAKKLETTEEKNIDKAIEMYNAILSSSGNAEDSKVSMQRLVSIYIIKNDWKKASEIYSKMVRQFPELKSGDIERQIASLQKPTA